MNFNVNDFKWIREPADYSITEDKIEIITKPHTDLWQRTYYHLEMIMHLFYRWRQGSDIFRLL